MTDKHSMISNTMLFSLFRIPTHWMIIIGQTSTKVKENNRFALIILIVVNKIPSSIIFLPHPIAISDTKDF